MKHIVVLSDDNAVLDVVGRSLSKYYRLTYKGIDKAVELLNEEVVKTEFGALHTCDDTDKAKQNEIADIILVDAGTNNKKGLEFLEVLKKSARTKRIPVIFIIAHADEKIIRKAFLLGAADVIVKPLMSVIVNKSVSTQLELFDFRRSTSEMEKYQDAISVSFAELVECRDITTGGHIKNSTLYFKLLLEEIMSLDRYKDTIPLDEARDVIRAVPLHDIGKIGINDEILRKASPLNYNEFEYMKTHTVLGKETFDKIIDETGGTRLLYIARDLAYCHHERWDGSGYPNGLKGEEIPLYARIMTIADVYDALTSQRSYKDAFSHMKAMSIMKEGKGTIFDPDLLDIFAVISNRFEHTLFLKEHNIAEI